MPIGAIAAGAGIVGNIIGGLAGKNAGQGDRDAGKSAVTDAYTQLANIGLPPDEARKIIYQQFQQKGLLTPELEEHINQSASQMGQIKEDPSLKSAQMNALQILSQRGKGGLTPEDRTALNQVRNQIATDTEGKRQQIMQNFQARGQGGSGAELISALQGAQSGANAESQAGDRLAAMASQNALQAIGQAGTLGGQIRGQEFGQQAQQAQAQDVINQFNTQNQVQQQVRNVNAQNNAQASNLQNAQNISNANTQQSNQELLREQEAKRQQYLDTLNRATTINNAATGFNTQMQNTANAEASSAAAPFQAVGAGLTTIGSSLLNKKPSSSGGYAGSDPASGSENMFAYNGGEIPNYDEGGDIKQDSSLADRLRDYFATKPVQQQIVNPNAAQQVSQSFKNTFSTGGGVTDFRSGGHVPGKANVPGDSPVNDTIPAMVSPGEFVIKRTVAKSPFGKKLIKLLEAHSEVMKHAPKEDIE